MPMTDNPLKIDKNNRYNRRLILKSLLSISMASVLVPATARAQNLNLFVDNRRGLWEEDFDVATNTALSVSSNIPVLSQPCLTETHNSILQYQDIVSHGGWPIVPSQQGTMRLGMIHPSVSLLRQRLIVSGDLDHNVSSSQSFDTYVETAIKRFQARHGLPEDGLVGTTTYKALNVDASIRLMQLKNNYKRLSNKVKVVSRENRFVMVNIPAAQIEAIENAAVVQRHTAIVGKIDRQTPILDSKINQIILNPFWTVPKSIIRKDIIPLMQKQPSYLTDNNIHLYNNKGQEVSPENVNWNSDEAVGLMFRQDPGKINAMSSTKINFSNPYAVYMHDTPQQTLFNNLMRFDSSGCVRIQNIRDLNAWILKNTPNWDRQKMETVIASRQNTPINISDPIPLHFVYISAWATGKGATQFRDDIYHMDGSKELAFDTAI
ncbi:L,D-transpeptidase family protein [Bartonella tamiae]